MDVQVLQYGQGPTFETIFLHGQDGGASANYHPQTYTEWATGESDWQLTFIEY